MLCNQGTPKNVRMEGEKELGEWLGQQLRFRWHRRSLRIVRRIRDPARCTERGRFRGESTLVRDAMDFRSKLHVRISAEPLLFAFIWNYVAVVELVVLFPVLRPLVVVLYGSSWVDDVWTDLLRKRRADPFHLLADPGKERRMNGIANDVEIMNIMTRTNDVKLGLFVNKIIF